MKDPLLSVGEAQKRLLEYFSPLEREIVDLEWSTGRTLAEDIVSHLDLPPFANSSMDGFAVRFADVAEASSSHPVVLQVVADIPAGQVVNRKLQPHQAARIMTGAVLPPGADAVVPVEDTDFSQRTPGVPPPQQVKIFNPIGPRGNVRPQGQDVHFGEVVMQSGSLLRPADVGFLAMLGIHQVPVYRPPKIAIFSTGDELVPVDQPLMPGQIYDSNTFMLISLVERYGGKAVRLGIVPDRAEVIQRTLDRAVDEKVDLILSSAGVSVGAFDFVRSVVEDQGKLDFWRVNMRPGKPLAFGQYKNIPFIGLPGNPVSSFVGFLVFVRPAILRMAGRKDWKPQTQTVRLVEPIDSDGRESYLRAIVSRENDELVARLTGHQGSGNLRSLVEANALLLIPSGVKSLPIGAETQAWLL
jgi:molybdopterin molybdotransferase